MSRQIIFGSCHLMEQKNSDFRSGKTATLWLSGDCHPTERSWMEVRHVLGSFILRSAQQEEALHRICPFSRVYDHSLPHSRLATAARVPARGLLPDYASDPLAGTVGRRVLPFLQYFIFISCSSFISKIRL
ncbi:unnamed protein product [Spirodela intermedia]|uniref:Uncharacterized protein n=1 Tax=Spirodela intermedia TaxID=51605 RepID=A0A7I8L773_SPIIN|nr:unnamed protein product [Spirodela intermedia]